MSTNETILVIGAGELGMEILRSLAKKTPSHSSTKITVLLRSATIDSHDPQKRKTTAELHALGISLLAGDIVTASTIELSKLFEPFHTIVGCAGFSAGRSIQVKLAHAVLDARVARYFPWQFGVDYDVIGRGSAQDLFDEQLETHGVLVPRLLLANAVPLKQVLVNEVIWGHLLGRLKLLGGCLDKQESYVRSVWVRCYSS